MRRQGCQAVTATRSSWHIRVLGIRTEKHWSEGQNCLTRLNEGMFSWNNNNRLSAGYCKINAIILFKSWNLNSFKRSHSLLSSNQVYLSQDRETCTHRCSLESWWECGACGEMIVLRNDWERPEDGGESGQGEAAEGDRDHHPGP